MQIDKAFFFGRNGRGAFRATVARAVAAQERTGREQGFHRGAAGVDRTLERGTAEGAKRIKAAAAQANGAPQDYKVPNAPKGGSLKWSARASVGQSVAGGDLHHTHPSFAPNLSAADLKAVVTSENSGRHGNTLWAHSKRGHAAARLPKQAASLPRAERARAFDEAARESDTTEDLRRKLKQRGLLVAARSFAKAQRSLNAPPSKAAGKRRADRYGRLAAGTGNGPVARIAELEAARSAAFAASGKYGRGITPGRADEEKYRADPRYREEQKTRRKRAETDANADPTARHNAAQAELTRRAKRSLDPKSTGTPAALYQEADEALRALREAGDAARDRATVQRARREAAARFGGDMDAAYADSVARGLKRIAELGGGPAKKRRGRPRKATSGLAKAGWTATVPILKADPTGRYIAGWASVIEEHGQPVVDIQGDLIDMEELRKAAHGYVSKARAAKVMHDGDPIGEVVESVLIDDDFAAAHGVTHGKRGWWIGMEIKDADVQRQVRDGELACFSIGGAGTRTPVEKASRTAP